MALRSTLLAILLLISTNFAFADEAKMNVVIISVIKATVPSKLPGICQISGMVGEVLEGKTFRRGQVISLHVPCGSHPQPLRPPGADAQLADPQVLMKSKQGIAHLDDAGALVWRETARSYRGAGKISGYRVFDGAILPLRAASLR